MRRRQIRRIHAREGFLDLNAEKAKATKEAWRENLNVDVIELQDAAKSQFLQEALKLVLSGGYHIDGEAEKVLAIRTTPNGSISFSITILASEAKGLIALTQELQPRDEPPVDL